MTAIIEYGVGNLFSLKCSLNAIGEESVVTGDADAILKADRVILPGVGAFSDACAKLRGSGLDRAVYAAADSGKPLLGICLGMQIAVIEYARNVLGIKDANSGEFDELCRHKVIDFMPGQSSEINKGGTLRLGAYPCHITPGTAMERCYGTQDIRERHRHRYEFNNDYREALEKAGLTFSG